MCGENGQPSSNILSKASWLDYTVPITGGEVDVKIEEPDSNGKPIEKWVEVKNVQSLTKAWGKALDQVENYITLNNVTHVIIQLPQQDINNRPGPTQQQMQRLMMLQKLYPQVKFEVRTGSSGLNKPIPFDPPSDNWGTSIP